MANTAIVSKSFQKFITARQTYRQQVENLSFPAYSDVVTVALHDTTQLEAIAQSLQTPSHIAIQQQALDYIVASKRAVDMRGKNYLDYVRDSQNARPQYDSYETARVDRYESNRF